MMSSILSANNSPQAQAPTFKTPLNDDQESLFQNWVKTNSIPFDDSAKSNYDMRGYFKNEVLKGKDNVTVSGYDKLRHFPDTYKTPYHETFSNESIYSKGAYKTDRHWVGNDLIGFKLVDSKGNVIKDETIGAKQ